MICINKKRFDKKIAPMNLLYGEIAEHLGYSRAQFSQALNGKIEASPRMRTKILEFLGGEFDDYFEIK